MDHTEKCDALTLNIGGSIYTVSKSVMRRNSECLIAQALAGKIKPEFDQYGHYFYDRDGKLFRYILNYLRNGQLILPRRFTEYQQLKEEACFFQLNELSTIIENVANASRVRTSYSITFACRHSTKDELITVWCPVIVASVICTNKKISKALSQLRDFEQICTIRKFDEKLVLKLEPGRDDLLYLNKNVIKLTYWKDSIFFESDVMKTKDKFIDYLENMNARFNGITIDRDNYCHEYVQEWRVPKEEVKAKLEIIKLT